MDKLKSWRHNRVESAADGSNPTVIVRMKSGFAVMGDSQFLPGYCLLLAYPKVKSLNELEVNERIYFLRDMTIIGDAIMHVLNPERINYDILGNSTEYLHAHILPRYAWEGQNNKVTGVSSYSIKEWYNPKYQYQQEKYESLKNSIRYKLVELMERNYSSEELRFVKGVSINEK